MNKMNNVEFLQVGDLIWKREVFECFLWIFKSKYWRRCSWDNCVITINWIKLNIFGNFNQNFWHLQSICDIFIYSSLIYYCLFTIKQNITRKQIFSLSDHRINKFIYVLWKILWEFSTCSKKSLDFPSNFSWFIKFIT